MLFNSIDFAVFLPIVFALYWIFGFKNKTIQNSIVVGASYFFYAWWDWRFLLLIIGSSLVDYLIGLQLEKTDKPGARKHLLWTSLVFNLGLLGFFKYYNFFIQSFQDAFTMLGGTMDTYSLKIILPVGISFYTFQTLSYTIDVYRKKIGPTHHLLDFASYVSFFPQLVAGPIERAKQLLPQFEKRRVFDEKEAILGINQIVWGLFKKLVIADNCAQYANDIFTNYQEYSSVTLVLGAVYFAFQIYGDFSGYSDIAIGTARLFGIRLMTNFKYPYFSRDIAEFWRRWHISLSTWFRDYLYIPLGGSKLGRWKNIRNVFIVFIVSGFWHGANWTFIAWGALNAILFLPLLLLKRNRNNLDVVAAQSKLPTIKEAFQMLVTFLLVTVGWIFFRAASMEEAIHFIQRITQLNVSIDRLDIERFSFEMIPLIILLLLIEWFSRKKEFPLYSKEILWIKTPIVIALIVLFGSISTIQDFIYFQF